MNKKIMVTVLSISLLHFSADAMNKSVSGFLNSAKNFLLPYEVIDHTYELAADGKTRMRYCLAESSDKDVVLDDAGTQFKAEKKFHYGAFVAVPQPKDGAFFVEKSAANKIKEREDDYDVQTAALGGSSDTSLKGARVFYRDNVGRYKLSFILNYPRMATSLKYGALMAAMYSGYSWFKSKSKKSLGRTDVESETEFEGDESN
jgi:hypothetical protein